jgi:endonuclease/exonuclease/phosphatase family metal-dependent hydrolase
MAFRKKANSILKHYPDILVVQECEQLEKIDFSTFLRQPSDKFWHGTNPNKGVGVFCFSGYKLKLYDWHNTDIRTFLPFSISKDGEAFNLYAVWAYNLLESKDRYVGQVWKAVNQYREYLPQIPSIIVGDFNSNTIWDGKKKKYNHTSVVKELERLGIHSLYHLHHGETHGKETQPTLFLQKKQHKPYHIDYCFASNYFSEKLQSVSVGIYGDWISLSDHMPIIIDIM